MIIKACRAFLLILLVSAGAAGADDKKRSWKSLSSDRLHDPESPAAGILQEPDEALHNLPYDVVGNKVNWVKALEDGLIEPRTNIFPETKIEVLDLDIIMGNTAEMPMVRFPHYQHTLWLDCKNCHDAIFKEEVDANPINMFAVLMGEYCGRCHGAVAFPLTECKRCHSVDRDSFKGNLGAQY